jgi:hypothetical protein
MLNHSPGWGLQVRWWPNDSFSILANQYYGHDEFGIPNVMRFHTDDSFMVRYYNNPETFVDRMALSCTFDWGYEHGQNISSTKQNFTGLMAYDRTWLLDNKFAFTFGGGWMSNPGRYLTLIPPINGATAFSPPDPRYWNIAPGQPFRGWDMTYTLDFMPTENVTFRLEFCHRFSSVPYWAAHGGVTPPGGNTGAPGSFVPGWAPDLTKSENIITYSLMVRF